MFIRYRDGPAATKTTKHDEHHIYTSSSSVMGRRSDYIPVPCHDTREEINDRNIRSCRSAPTVPISSIDFSSKSLRRQLSKGSEYRVPRADLIRISIGVFCQISGAVQVDCDCKPTKSTQVVLSIIRTAALAPDAKKTVDRVQLTCLSRRFRFIVSDRQRITMVTTISDPRNWKCTHFLLDPVTWKPIRTSPSSHDPSSLVRRSKILILMQARMIRDQPFLRTHPVFLLRPLRFSVLTVRPARSFGNPR